MESIFYEFETLKLDIMIKHSEIKKVAKEKFGNGKYLTDKEDGFRQGAEWALEQVKNCSIPAVINQRELLVAFNKEMSELCSWFLPAEDSMIDEFLNNQ